ncbi:ABC transporter permease [Auritidibacter ignavus]|uniref:ABC transporter permease n=1 Tax=Auritidibacter ignavus TaxID=678932 RepID=UPI00109D3625|nr:ABC transporter permease [Auritidibacter ignavus]
MKALGLEFSKLKRKRLWLTVLLVLGFEVVWVLLLLINAFGRDISGAPKDTGFVIGQVSQVHTIFASIFATVIVSRLAAMEHDGGTMPMLFAANQSRGSLFRAKYLLAAGLSTFATLVIVAAVSALAAAQGVALDMGLIGVWLLGLVLATLAIVAIQLFLALLFQRQAVTLTVGIIGGLIGSSAGFVPPAVASLVPWQYPGLITPVRTEVVDGTIVGFSMIENLGALIAVVAVVGVLCAGIGQAVFSRQISK